jgi:aryl-alcohol dehydrogenase-like predicted oxidoreductase
MPRLIFAWSAWPQEGEVRRVAYLQSPRTTIGSAPECDIQVDGLQELHAVIDRTAGDEYVLTHVAAEGTSLVAGVPAAGSLLRTGAAVALDDIRLTYFREEYADHGRPFGGRIGGELGHQRPQRTPRPRAKGSVGKPRTNRDPGQYFH